MVPILWSFVVLVDVTDFVTNEEFMTWYYEISRTRIGKPQSQPQPEQYRSREPVAKDELPSLIRMSTHWGYFIRRNIIYLLCNIVWSLIFGLSLLLIYISWFFIFYFCNWYIYIYYCRYVVWDMIRDLFSVFCFLFSSLKFLSIYYINYSGLEMI